MAHRCLNCMASVENENCPNCGYPAVGKNEEHQLSVGTILHERYQLGKVLGQGGFGITYLAWDLLMHRPVAVKEFFPIGTVYRVSSVSSKVECVSSTVVPHYRYSKERFLREARALVEFRDLPEVVGIYDFIEENETAYIVMEYIKGVDLAKYICRRGGALPVEETFRILRPVMEALAKVHKGGIVHRDISPDNIMLDPMGGAKLLDFGAVRTVGDPNVQKELTRSTEAILKHGFAPLEQYNTRGSLGPWTDEYAMCATVWYCLTGTVPLDPPARLMEGTDPDWSTIPGLPEHQQRALRKGISCRAQDRYASMEQLLADLFPEAPQQAGYMQTQPAQSAADIPVPQQGVMGTGVPAAQEGNGYADASGAYGQGPDRKRSKKARSAVLIGGVLTAVLLAVLAVFAFLGADRGSISGSGHETRVSSDEHSHQWVSASCTEPERCSGCGETKGAPLGHDWADATCTEDQKCRVCGAAGDPALGHRWIPATKDLPECCSNCGSFQGRSLGIPLVNFLPRESSEENEEDDDIQVGTFTDISGNTYEDALCFWVSEWLVPYEYIEYTSPDFTREGFEIQIEYSIGLANDHALKNGLHPADSDLCAYVDVFMDGVRVDGTGMVSGGETGSGVWVIPAGSILKIYCKTTSTAWTDCIFKATVYYTALPEQPKG